MTVFVVEMLRWGDDETHHYILGVFNSLREATKAGEIEKSWRGGKYEHKVVGFEVMLSHRDVMDCEQIANHLICSGGVD